MQIIIDGIKCEANPGEYILDIARRNGIEIPTLCHSDALPGQGVCRLCIVEVIDEGRSRIVTSCIYPVTKEIEVKTRTEKIIKMRKNIIMLLAARTPQNKLINRLMEEYDIPPITRFKVDSDEECILCGLCVRACDEIGISAISTVDRGITKKISTSFDEPSKVCIGCAACAYVCPTGAIKVSESGNQRTIWGKSFELLRCSSCGEYFITREHYEYVRKRLDNSFDEILCDKCKKKTAAMKLTKTVPEWRGN